MSTIQNEDAIKRLAEIEEIISNSYERYAKMESDKTANPRFLSVYRATLDLLILHYFNACVAVDLELEQQDINLS